MRIAYGQVSIYDAIAIDTSAFTYRRLVLVHKKPSVAVILVSVL